MVTTRMVVLTMVTVVGLVVMGRSRTVNPANTSAFRSLVTRSNGTE